MVTLKGKKIMILVAEEFQDLEVMYPYYRLKEAGAEVIVAGTGNEEYRGKYGYPIKVNGNVEEYRAEEFDAVIIPGGWAPDRLRRSKEINSFVAKMNMHGKVIAAICHAGSVLVSANVLKGKTATCYDAIKDDLVNAGAKYVDKSVCVDGNLITSRKPDDLPDFCREIISKLSK